MSKLRKCFHVNSPHSFIFLRLHRQLKPLSDTAISLGLPSKTYIFLLIWCMSGCNLQDWCFLSHVWKGLKWNQPDTLFEMPSGQFNNTISICTGSNFLSKWNNLINHSNFLLPHLCFPSSNTILHVEVVRLIKTGLLLRKHRYKWLQTKPRYILYKSHNKYASTTVCTLLLLEMCWVNFVFFIADCSLRCCLTEQHYTKRCFFNTLTDIQKGTKL